MHYRRAAALGEPKALLALGRMYAYGRGQARDPERAVCWLRRAMTNDDASVRRQAAQQLRADVHNGAPGPASP
jgi:TPR repeat protein